MPKYARYLFTAVVLLASWPAMAQQNPQPVNAQFYSVGWSLQNPPLPVPSASVTLVGNPGPATYNFWVVASFTIGNSQPAGPFTLSAGPNSFSASNYARLSWTAAPGAIAYDILETPTNIQPSGACGCAVATGQTGTTFNVISNSLSAYTVTSIDPNAYLINSQNVGSAPGASELLIGGAIRPMLVLPGPYIVASLPAPASRPGYIAEVSDGITASDCTVGGGTNYALCISNGMAWVPFPNGGSGGLNPGGAYQLVNYGPTGGTSGYPDAYLTSSPTLFLSTASGGIQSYGGFTSGGGSPATNGILTLQSTHLGVVNGGWSLTPSPTFTAPGYGWYVPDADTAGCLQSPGGGTPGSPSQIFITPCPAASMVWPAGTSSGIAAYAYPNSWGSVYNASNVIPANFITNPLNQSTTGNAGTASAAAAAGSECSFGQAARGVDASWNAKDCFAPGTANYSGTPNIVPKGSATANTLEDGSMFDDKTHYVQSPNGLSTEASGLAETIYPNDNPGTVLYDPVCLHNVGGLTKAFDCGTSNTSGLAGIAVEGAGITGSVRYCVTYCPANFDNTAIPGDIAIKSTTTTGLHDTGGTTNVPGVDQFIVATAAGGPGGIPTIEFWTPRNQSVAANGGGGGGSGGNSTKVQINGTPSNAVANFNGTTPAAESNYTLGKWQSSNSGNTTNASVEVPYCSSSVFGVCEVDGTTITATNGVISAAAGGSGFLAATFPAIVTAQTWQEFISHSETFAADFAGATVFCATAPAAPVTFTLTDYTFASSYSISSTIGTVIVSGPAPCSATLATTGHAAQAVVFKDLIQMVSGTDPSSHLGISIGIPATWN